MSNACCGTMSKNNGTDTLAPSPWSIDSIWKFADYYGAIAVRLFDSKRNSYKVNPGLYKLGHPAPDSPVFASANYKLSFDILRKSLSNIDCWILVLDTKGINVWCAAGKGTFGTNELNKQIMLTNLHNKVTHRKIIVPQLGASNLKAHEVKKLTDFHVEYGPVRARDLKEYLNNGHKASAKMRAIQFPMYDRFILTPMEIAQAYKPVLIFLICSIFLTGVIKSNLQVTQVWRLMLPIILGSLISLAGGAFITPLFLPFIPFRSFALKGLWVGILCIGIYLGCNPEIFNSLPLFIFLCIMAPAFSSFLALNFTGASTFTNPSGVKKEMKASIPFYIGAAAISLSLLIAFFIQIWRAKWYI